MAGIGCAYGSQPPPQCTVFPWQDCLPDSGQMPTFDAERADHASDTGAESSIDQVSPDVTTSDGSESDVAPHDGEPEDAPADGSSRDATGQ
jgi:hypothetical protein